MRKSSHVTFYRAADGFRWSLRSPNGRIIASGEGFSSQANARASFAAVQKYAPKAVERA